MKLQRCDRCQVPSDDLTVCVHYDNNQILGHLCPQCVRDWLVHLDQLPLEEEE
jgi:hypothetical protein